MPVESISEDELAARRLTGLLDYVEALVKLDERVATRLSQHKLPDGAQFILHQHELAGLPALQFDTRDVDGPVWLRIQRLQRTIPPAYEGQGKEWIDISNDPLVTPVIQDVLHTRVTEEEHARLLMAGEVRPEDCSPLKSSPDANSRQSFFDVMLRLEDRPAIRDELESYCAGPWAKWSESEKPRRRSIAVYQRLFEIAQRLLQAGGSESIELVLGIGLSRWTKGAEAIDLPMIECGVEIEIAETGNAEITIRPRGGVTRVELRPFEKLAGVRFVQAEDAARRCLRSLENPDSEGISPYRQESFEPILKICGSQLDPEGRYLPNQRQLKPGEPAPDAEGEFLTVTDRYVIYARRRSNNSVLQDIDRLKKSVAPVDGKPIKIEGSTRTLVLGPKDGIDGTFVPLGNTIGTFDPKAFAAEEPVDRDHEDLFFPKPFNDEQVQIIRRLESSDGLVVQGPPGTGKTHTIANIISHMLATGRRVLVVSHGETALRVIQEQLPDGVRDLAISVTTSEREGMKQIEKTVGLMLGVVNTIDANRARQAKLIANIEARIVTGRNKLKAIDEKLATLALRHFTAVPGTEELPDQAAKRLVEEGTRFGWFTDRPPTPFQKVHVRVAEVEALFAARRTAKADLKYCGENLPSAVQLPDPTTLRAWHDDLVAAQELRATTSASEIMTRRVIARVGLDRAAVLAEAIQELAATQTGLRSHRWASDLSKGAIAQNDAAQRIGPTLQSFLFDAKNIVQQRAPFLARPVHLPQHMPPLTQCFAILDALAVGKNPFGMLAFGTKSHKSVFAEIRVAGQPPDAPDDWRHVRSYVDFCGSITGLSTRWDALKTEISAPDNITFGLPSISNLAALSDILHTCIAYIPSTFKDISTQLTAALGSQEQAAAILREPASAAIFADALSRHVASVRLEAVRARVHETVQAFEASTCDLAGLVRQILADLVGQRDTDVARLMRVWEGLGKKLDHIRALAPLFQRIKVTSAALSLAGAPTWASRLSTMPPGDDGDREAPADWQDAWNWAAQMAYLERIGATKELADLHAARLHIEKELRDSLAVLVKERTFLQLALNMKGSAKAALQGFAQIIRRLGAGTGQRAVFHRQNAREAMLRCYEAVPCWIMPTWRVSEQLPADLASFDLVILDEASQSDARELPALLRGRKVLVVGDDRQVSPSSAFLSIANIARLRQNFLSEFPFRAEIEPGASLYDLARVMFPAKFVMLKEHFRCVEPIIRFSMQFYNDPLVPLRVPKASERLDPPLIDIYVEDGARRGKSKINPREAEVIVEEIAAVVAAGEIDESKVRSIGVISLIGAEQAQYIQKQLMERVGEASMVRHRIVCGDSATLQGDERDIVFISMIADMKRKQAQTSTQYQQRFNVALSRARDRMVLVRSVREEDLNPKDLKARVIAHFRDPMPGINPSGDLIALCQSDFEKAVFLALVRRGYRVIPQVGSVGFSIDMVVEGESGRRLAIECDGDQYHGPQQWAADMRRQRILERVGWDFWRCFGSNYRMDPEGALDDLVATLERMNIKPVGTEASGRQFSEHRTSRAPELESGDSGHDDADASIMEQPLAAGDRVVIRYLDAEPSRPQFYVLTDAADDPMNGLLSLSSPLGEALKHHSPGDEFTLKEGSGERSVLFVLLESEAAQAA